MTNPFSNTVKLLTAINLLAAPQGTTIKGLMENLNTSRRSVFRMLQALEHLGFPLVEYRPLPKTEKTYRLMDSYVMKLPNIVLPNPGFTGEEIELVLSILDLCEQVCQLGGIHRLNAIREKITAIKPDIEKGQVL